MSSLLRGSTVYKGVLISRGWNRGALLYTEVSSFQGLEWRGSTVKKDFIVGVVNDIYRVFYFILYCTIRRKMISEYLSMQRKEKFGNDDSDDRDLTGLSDSADAPSDFGFGGISSQHTDHYFRVSWT